VLADIDAHGATRIWCLGDTVGYGPFVNECVELIAARCEVVLAGNHDLAVRGDLDPKNFAGTAGAGIDYAIKHLEPAMRAHLDSWSSPSWLIDNVELYHGSALDPVWQYVRDEKIALLHLQEQETALSLVGHSHAQLVFELPDGASEAMGGQASDGVVMPLSIGVRRVVNPGSVGQPRDRDPRASWALLEPTRVAFHRVEYDIPRMRAAVDAAGLPGETGERLELGW
jgi:diadenosine tetraphosphatase ApaH/serine/threonine PP2A family protein phosphatase